MYGGVDVYVHAFLTTSLVGSKWSASRPGRFTPGERTPGSHWIGGWVDPRAGLDDVEKRKFLTLPRLELRPLGRPTRSLSLYRLLELLSIQNIYFFRQHKNSLRGIQMNIYIKFLNLKRTTCCDPYWIIIRCRLM
jgi:hypothetical protein